MPPRSTMWVFGLETHVELSTNTKLFCPAHIEFGASRTPS